MTDTETLLAEGVLEAVSKLGEDLLAPKAASGTAAIIACAWDEPQDAAGHRLLKTPLVGEVSISEQMDVAWTEEAGLEQRVAVGIHKLPKY